MTKHYKIVIAGAGGIAEATALLLAEWSQTKPDIFIGNRTLSKAQRVAKWVKDGTSTDVIVKGFHLPETGRSEEIEKIFRNADIILDCLPGTCAPRMAGFAKEFNMHYANLTEYVKETDEITELAKDAKTGFILQTGLAPGYIDVLANGMFQQFCKDFDVEKADKLEFKVGALTDHAVAPHFYGFTWSPIGVATEYMKDAIAIRDFKKTVLPALSERKIIIIDGITYEEDLTSGGAADLPEAMSGKVRSLDYKTLRYPGHYAWVQEQISSLRGADDIVESLESKMQEIIPHIEEDQIVLYAAVEGKDAQGVLRRREISKLIKPQTVGKHKLRAIQTTTAVPLLQSAQFLLKNNPGGIILQSEIDPVQFLNGNFITPVYGTL